jgi:hypothetical protein
VAEFGGAMGASLLAGIASDLDVLRAQLMTREIAVMQQIQVGCWLVLHAVCG